MNTKGRLHAARSPLLIREAVVVYSDPLVCVLGAGSGYDGRPCTAAQGSQPRQYHGRR